MDAGGLAQMSYNNVSVGNGLGLPGSGFGARRANGTNIKRLSFDPKLPLDPRDGGAPTPRTSRSHLLAGLRTAPKSATYNNMPSTAPPSQQQFHAGNGLGGSMFAPERRGSARTSGLNSQPMPYSRQMFPVTDQILAPPELPADVPGQENMDPNLYAQLVATNVYLAEQQQRLQQQLLNVQAAAAQMQGLNLNKMSAQFATPPITPQHVNAYQQQQVQQQQVQPIITPVAGAQPGVYSYYNPVTGQQSYFYDNSVQNQYNESPVLQTLDYSPPQQPGTPRLQVSPPPIENAFRSLSPPKKSPPPHNVAPLPPPSAGAFRRGHRKAESMAFDKAVDSPKGTLTPKTGNLPGTLTPTAVGLGPGQARAGEHPMRQPRGPPPLDELKAKPTTKFEGSKNFATRTRRSAVHNLVRAGMDRRRAEGSMSPVSEVGERPLSLSGDDGSESGRSGSGSLSGDPSIGSSRTSAHGAIGSDRPSRNNSFERKSTPSMDLKLTSASLGSEEGHSVVNSFAAVFKNGGKKLEVTEEKKRAPMLVLTSTERRKSTLA